MIKRVVCAAALLWSATIVRADVFSYSYSGLGTGLGDLLQSVSGNGQITATADGGGVYTITALSGTQNGKSVSLSSDKVFAFNGSSVGTFDFLLGGSTYVLAFIGGGYGDGIGPAASVGTFNISTATTVPEAATISLLLTMGLGIWVFGRKLPLKRRL
jgi:hypothetical protein